jgi:hypothetical protein
MGMVDERHVLAVVAAVHGSLYVSSVRPVTSCDGCVGVTRVEGGFFVNQVQTCSIVVCARWPGCALGHRLWGSGRVRRRGLGVQLRAWSPLVVRRVTARIPVPRGMKIAKYQVRDFLTVRIREKHQKFVQLIIKT